MVLVQANRYLWIHFFRGFDHLANHDITGVATCTATCLQDDGRIYRLCRIHNCQHLLHVVDIEGGHPVTVFGRMVE